MTTPPCQVFIDAFHNAVDVSMTFKFLSMIYGDKLSIRRTIQRVCKVLRNDGDDKEDLGLSLPMLVSLEHLSLVLAITIISERTL